MKKYLIASVFVLALLPGIVLGVETTGNGEKNEPKKQEVRDETSEDLKVKIKEMKETKTALKEKLKSEILEKVKTRAEKAVDKAIAKYEKTKSKVQKMPNISAENKLAIVAKIDEAIANLESLRAKIALANTSEEVKAIMAEVKTQMKSGYKVVKAAVSAIHATRLTEITAKLASVLDKLTAKVVELKTAGKDVVEMDKLVLKAKTEISDANAKITTGDLDQAKERALAARETLREISQKIKAEKGGE
jgi:hypothetical protein